MLRPLRNGRDELSLCFMVGDPVLVEAFREARLEFSIVFRDPRMLNEVVAKQKTVPVLETSLDHVEMVSPVSLLVALYEPSLERRRAIAR